MRTVIDLGALDVFRAYGLERSVSFTELAGGEIAVSHTPDVAADASKFDENSKETACQTTSRRL
jgi:hypothetical protein